MAASAYGGDNRIDKLNLTTNYCSTECLMRIEGSSKILSNVKYSTFFNNTATGGTGSRIKNSNLNYCNYINNFHRSNGLIVYSDNVTISNSVFKGNKGVYLFRQDSGQLTTSNVYLENNILTYGPSLNNAANSSFELELKHISTYLCEAKLPLKFEFGPTDCVNYLSDNTIAFSQLFTT